MKIEVDGVELTVMQDDDLFVTVSKVVGRDRKRKVDVRKARTFAFAGVLHFVSKLKTVAALQTARCTCGYHYGCSDHSEHCHSIYVAADDSRGDYDDD